MDFRKPALTGAFRFLLFFSAIISTAAADGPLAWPPITSQTRPWVYWWWMGSAVDKTNLTRELTRYHTAGLGGVHIIPIYGARGFESNYISYLSPKWMEMMSWSVTEAKRLGMGVDMTTGTGWCFGGPNISDADANASVVVKTFDLGVGERLGQKFDRKTIQALVAFSPDGKSFDLTGSITTNGEVFFSPPGNRIGTGTSGPPKIWKVYAISQKPSGQKVKRAAPGGEGWMLNPLYADAMSNYLKRFSGAFDHYSGAKPRAQYQDSYEYRSDWSPNFFAEFEKRRGYKLQNELPALFGTNRDDHTARVLCDYRETASDIMTEETLPLWVKWSHEHGFITREEAHGSPGNLLDLYATADIPETEFFSRKRNLLVSKFASSAAHIVGRRLTASETGTWLAEHFTETLAEMKSVVDDMFLSGVNHIFYHGCCYSPDEAGWPGWLFYASTEMNPRNSIWRDAPALNDYVARCQSFLQSGKTDNDVLLYWPIFDFWNSNDPATLLPQLQVEAASQACWFEGQPIGKTARELWDRGFAFDYVSDRQLQMAKVKDGEIEMPGGHYQVIVVPPCDYMPLATFKQLLALAGSGATIDFEGSGQWDVPGWGNLEKRRAKSLELYKTLTNGVNITNSKIPTRIKRGKGLVIFGDYKQVLGDAGAAREPMADVGLSFVRRSFDGGWNYFIANRSQSDFDGWVTLGRTAKSIVILDPMTGNSGVAAIRESGGQTQIYLQLQGGESFVLRAFASKEVKGAAWNYWRTNGHPFGIAGVWHVRFISGGPVIPADSQMTRLASWTTLADANAQSFAGSATYSIAFDAPPGGNKNYFLDLGDVRQSARVKLNGKDYGALITAPFRVVVDNLKPSGNELEVEVTSVSANRIRDLDRRGERWKTFHDIDFVDIHYQPFDASGWPLTEGGLLGPVTLTAVKPFTN
ncbi:MAG: glycosyl hydrolase [Limisphaerales bacterium]